MLDDGRVGRLWDVTDEVMVELGIPTGQKNSSDPPSRDGRDPTVIRYRVDPDLRRQFLTLSDDDSRSAGRIVEDIMYRYARDGGGVIDRVIERLERVTTADDDLKPEKGATERRRDTLATTLAGPERTPWTLDDMDTALEEEVRGVSASKHARQKHLRPVLDRIDYTWHPQNPRLFLPREEVDVKADDDRRDPRGRPPVLHDADTMRVAVATEAVEKALDTTGRVGKLSLGEASDVIGKPDYSGLKTAFQAAESRYDCAKVVDSDGSVGLAVRVDTYRENPPRELHRHLDDTLAGGSGTDAGVIDGGTDADDGEPEPDGDAPDDWVAAAAERYPDNAPPDAPENLMNNCIVRAKTGTENVSVEQIEAVSEDERQLLRDRLAAADSDADTPARTRQTATDGGQNGDPDAGGGER
jgi:hypothetical protein